MSAFNLPLEIISEAVLPLLTWIDIVYVDLAVINHDSRVRWLDALSMFHIDPLSHGYTINERSFRPLKWWCDKKAWFDNITLNTDTSSHMLQLLLDSKYDWKRIAKLLLHDNDLDDDVLCPFLSRLTNVQIAVLATHNKAAAHTLITSTNQLKTVYLIGCAHTDAAMILFGEHQADLEGLYISRCDNISATAIAEYLKQAHVLRELYCSSNVTDTVLSALKYCPRMQKLHLWADTDCTDVGLQTIGDYLHDLRSIELHWLPHTSDAPFIAIARGCPLLTRIAFGSCAGVTDSTLLAVGLHCHLLETLSIESNDDITDSGIAALAQGCPALQTCLLYNCANISNPAVLALVHHCTSLLELTLGGCVLVTDEAIREVFRHCATSQHKLQHMDASRCPLVTAACLDVLQNLPANDNLKRVTIADRTLSEAERRELDCKYPFVGICYC